VPWAGGKGKALRRPSKGECSFLKKAEARPARTKRLLGLRQRMDPGIGRRGLSCGESKVFWFFSSEKNFFLAFTPALA
jgi:hypothetical protein